VRARQELERLNSIKDDFLSLATHELRTPLTAIQGNVELMLHSLRKATEGEKSEASQRLRLDQQKQLLERTVQQVVRMSKLINQMLDVTRMRGKVFELQMSNNVDIVALTRSVIDQASHDNHAVVLKADEESIKGRMDEMRVEQVLTNLLSNAIKYSPKGTTVTIAVKRDAEKNEAVISVRDQGMGISPEDQQHIFNRFYRAEIRNSAKVEGLGLGLYISYEIVQQHGGSTWLESEPNAGSTFYFSLPLHSA
jgi:signal transduction histidine kinase